MITIPEMILVLFILLALVVGGLVGIAILKGVLLGPLAFLMQCCLCGIIVAYTEDVPGLVRVLDWIESFGTLEWFV